MTASSIKVPNKFPAKPSPRRICIVGEAPGTQEVHWHTCNACSHEFSTRWRDQRGPQTTDRCLKCFSTDIRSTPAPFVGPSGWLLEKLLGQVGWEREACFVGNVCQLQPPANDISNFKWTGEEVQGGLQQLRLDLAAYQPHFCLLLGNTPLRAFMGSTKVGVGDRRGYFFESDFISGNGSAAVGFPVVKCMPTYHPAALLRESNLTGYARNDFKRAAEESRTDGLEVPQRTIDIALGKKELLAKLAAIRANRTYVDLDIEGGCGMGPACIGFATAPSYAFVVPFYGVDGESIWCESDEVELVEAVEGVLSDPTVPKGIMNAIYEMFVVAWTWGIVIRGVTDDIMLQHFELYCEWEKSLEVQASIYTKQPYWKLDHRQVEGRYVPFKDGKRATNAEWFTYNGTDCCVTAECREVQARQLMPKQREHYLFNVKLLVPLVYMMLRGIRYDTEEAQRRLAATQKRIYALQDRINREAAASRPALAAFFSALGLQRNCSQVVECTADEVAESELQSGANRAALVTILRTSFCIAAPREKRQVTETTWQPMRHNGKKWVRAGKRVKERPEGQEIEHAEGGTVISGPQETIWQPFHKITERNCPVEIATFEDLKRFAKASCKDAVRRCCHLLSHSRKQGVAGISGAGNSDCGGIQLTPAQRGELATLLGVSVKINATSAGGDAQWFLYEHCTLPKQMKKEAGRATDKLASDDEAIIKAWVATKDRRAIWFLNLRQLVTSTKSLAALPDADGRIRSEYNLVGAETHRLTNYGSPTGSSDLNLQTVTKGHRVLYKADEGCWMAQRDLSGADGWTVAAYCAMLGDPTMVEDYKAKLKPAQILVLMLDKGAAVNRLSREELKPLCKPITEENDWRYFAMKRVQHGGCFTAGHELLTPDGWKPVEHVQVSDKIAVYDNQTRDIRFEQPQHMHSFLYSGNLYTFRGHTVDMTVTADHRMPYMTNGNAKVITAAEMFYRKAAHLPTAGNYFTESGCYDEPFGRLLAAIQSDGCYTKRGYLVFNFRKQRKIERIEMLLRINDLRFTKHRCSDNTTKFSITDRGSFAPWKQFGKQATGKMLCFSYSTMMGYLNEYPHWDGSIKGDIRQLFSVHKEHLEWIDTFLHLCGANGCDMGSYISGFGSKVYRMSINDRSFADLGCLKERTVEEGVNVPVYCPTVSTGFVMVRRSGKIFASGNSYMMWKNTMSDQILTDSFKKTGKPIYVPPSKCEEMLVKCLFVRYPGLPRLHAWMEREIGEKGELRSSDGFVRRFYGRKDDKTTVKAALAHLPQYYTTRATMLALHRLWTDAANRREDGSLRVEPLHTVHDSLVAQFKKEETEWAKGKLREWFENCFTIAQTKLVIPASGTYGPSWGEQVYEL